MAKATFGAGCFWGVEEDFRKVPGVVGTAVGYSGGTLGNRRTKTSAATAPATPRSSRWVRPAKTSYETLLDVFWNGHNPTQLNRQGRMSARSTAPSSSSTRPAGGGRARLEGAPGAEAASSRGPS
jgi:peptide methionine sulfoxide reductase MsrA